MFTTGDTYTICLYEELTDNPQGGIMAVLEQTRQLKRSVKKEDTPNQDGIIQFFFNSLRTPGTALPPTLPTDTHYMYYRKRDKILLSTPKYESQWAAAIGIAISKMASMGWDVDGKVKTRRDRLHDMLLEAGAGMGLFGWVPFLTMHLKSYLCTGLAFVEIERQSKAAGSKVINIHHLNPLRCRLTGNPKFPVNYLTRSAEMKTLAWHQVMVISDELDPTEGEDGIVISAAARAYRQIVKQAGIETFIFEKVTGRRPLAINFVSGLSRRNLDDMMKTAQNAADRKGLTSYMGAAIVPVSGDNGVTSVSIPIAELPDITDVERERNRTDLIYANAIGIDPQSLNPRLLGGQGLGSTGNQAQVLGDKDGGRGLSMWRQQFTHNINQLVADNATTFSFSERDLNDEEQEAKNKKTRNEDRKIMIETGMITPEQATNLAVDDDDLPREFITQDETGGDSLRDDQKPEEENTPSKTAENSGEGENIDRIKELIYNDPDMQGVDLSVLRPSTAEEWKEVYH